VNGVAVAIVLFDSALGPVGKSASGSSYQSTDSLTAT
jgi:hypothetical protein